MSIVGDGLPDYCLTILSQGQLVYRAEEHTTQVIEFALGLTCRGRPKTSLTSNGAQENDPRAEPRARLPDRTCELEAAVSITDVALRFGFTNAGRFSRFYRDAFSNSPSDAIGRRGH
jgi:AraC-like DNA-binding protein